MAVSTVKKFFGYIEIKTKITSVLTFLLILSYFFHKSYSVNLPKTIAFCAGMLFFDLTATAINNYTDTKKNGADLQFNRTLSLFILFVLLVISIVCGLWLVLQTDITVLFLGGLCFLFGILYSYGPVPISHTPFGEIFSGFFYGFMIPFIMLYINLPSGSLYFFDPATKLLTINLFSEAIFDLLLLSVVPFCLTAGIMLANNTCDIKQDLAVDRFTLPSYIGVKKSVWLFSFLYVFAFIGITAAVIFNTLSLGSLLSFAVAPMVYSNCKKFSKKQIKSETFGVSVSNFILVIVTLTLSNTLGAIVERLII